jgi:2-keto-4-pentenoate hydratase/2-oxohepta-3-ene-1,7-dioic acid hydratase in catechol pathway
MYKNLDIKNYLPGKIICVGMNYKSHIDEQDGRFPSKPVLFAKSITSVIKDGENIIYPKEVSQLDYEVELAVIIGEDMKKIPAQDVNHYIYGYTIINDITARDIQKKEGQWFRAKSFDTFAPIGPIIVPKEEIKDPQNLKLKSFINNTLAQDSNTSEMIFKIDDLISFISYSMTIKKGDLIATGTPAGVGIFSKEQKLLKIGDKVECEIEKIGILTNCISGE